MDVWHTLLAALFSHEGGERWYMFVFGRLQTGADDDVRGKQKQAGAHCSAEQGERAASNKDANS